MPTPPHPAASDATRPGAAAWRDEELASSPHDRADKPDKVRRMFAAIAHAYDLNNRVHSGWRDQAWRREAVRLAGVRPGDACLDAACGTGDLTRALAAARTGPPARVVGLDFTPEMLDIAREKPTRIGLGGQRGVERAGGGAGGNGWGSGGSGGVIEYVRGDAMALPFADAEFDAVTIAFGIRNVAEPPRALAEFFRVLKPGGRLVVLEFATPLNPIIRAANAFYTGVVMPRTATLLARDRSGAYKYLPRSIDTFLDRDALSSAIADAGFADVTQRPMTFGVCAAHRGVRPGSEAD